MHPNAGAVVWFLADGTGAALFNLILVTFARDVGEGADKRALLVLALLVLDGAGCHSAGKVAIPEDVALEFLSFYSPVLQPTERLWPLINEAVAPPHFAGHEAADLALTDRCCALANDPDRLRGITWFHWWSHFAWHLINRTL